MKIIELLFITMRPGRWWRVLVIFLPLIVTGGTTNIIIVLKMLVAFIIFSLLTGAINIIDDIVDFEQDKKDLIKRTMPIASGELSRNKAEFSLGMILVGSFVAALFLGASFGAAVFAYFFIELCYYLFLKRFAILDALTIGAETSTLLIGGGLACAKNISPWLFIFTIVMAVLLVFCERKRTMLLFPNSSQISFLTVNYNEMGLEQSINITAAFVLILYSFYSLVSPEAICSYLVYSIPFVMWGIYRIIMLTYDKSSDRGLEKILLKDWMLWGAVSSWVVLTIILTAIK